MPISTHPIPIAVTRPSSENPGFGLAWWARPTTPKGDSSTAMAPARIAAGTAATAAQIIGSVKIWPVDMPIVRSVASSRDSIRT